MTALTKEQVKDLIVRTQKRCEEIEHENWDAATFRYRITNTAMWHQAAAETAPADWAEIIRVLAQGESYYGGAY